MSLDSQQPVDDARRPAAASTMVPTRGRGWRAAAGVGPCFVLAALGACTSHDVGSESTPNDPRAPASVRLSGAVQKGPFIVGSAIRISNLDADTNPTGLIFSTTTRDDLGQFELEFEATELVSIEGSGFYYNEVTGSLSVSPITLRALYAVDIGNSSGGAGGAGGSSSGGSSSGGSSSGGSSSGGSSSGGSSSGGTSSGGSSSGGSAPDAGAADAGVADAGVSGNGGSGNGGSGGSSNGGTGSGGSSNGGSGGSSNGGSSNGGSGSVISGNAGDIEDAHVNVITHLTYDRVQALMAGGQSYDAALAQAEQELTSTLGVVPPGFVPGVTGVQMNVLGGDTNGNAYLFAVSTVLAQAAQIESPDSADASLQNLLNHIALDLATTGSVDSGRRAQIVAALAAISAPDVEAAFAARFTGAVVPDLDRILDQDGDGMVNIADDCPTLANPFQEDNDLDGLGNVCDADRDGDGSPNLVDTRPDDPNEWTDTDGVPDATDNCLGLNNADQTDTDGDHIGDACDPDAPSCNALTEGNVRCVDQSIEICTFGTWYTAQTCDFWCTAGACTPCDVGDTFCDVQGGSTHVTAWICDSGARLRKFVSATTTQTCLPPDFPTNVSSLPIDTSPPRWVGMLGSQ